ncbi:hypothetical protein BKP37_06480 [Anaerobacillus alkalilacustris]|uniref:Uncharacterized protein n=1 Tax=Anaerobacillus alkalilacustris TaxID=393763 RepID=A0A1S2LUT3_9BACI|nr:hypothetical protein [Anaerobacillus alkalilacustris]OIJ15417.1 hypothetical protein BKP37_06480 [Anaerobacillus alkalilacustris]
MFLEYNKEEDSWEGYYEVNSHEENGTWTFQVITVEDHAGNRQFIYERDFDDVGARDFEIINEVEDVTQTGSHSVLSLK